jgi:uncharacterized membrane protein YgdD (TMEM256/DUF423 family)
MTAMEHEPAGVKPAGTPQRLWIALGALAGLGAVAMAAVGAHVVPETADPRVGAMLRSAIQMQGWHALALLACGLWAERGGRLANCAGLAFIAGTVLFCGAIYALALGGLHLAMLAPIGGTLLMLGWALLAASAMWPR